MTIDELRNLNGTDGNEACHAFWDACGAELLALWEAANHVSCGSSEQSPEYYSHTKVFNSALDALNAKAASMSARLGARENKMNAAIGIVPCLETEDQREFWAFVEETAREVRSWPGWMRGELDGPNDAI